MEDRTSKGSLGGFVYYLSENKLLDGGIAFAALKQASASNVSYIEHLIKQRLLDPTIVAMAISEYYGLPRCDLTAINMEVIPNDVLNMPYVRKRLALPVFIKNDIVYLAVTDPTIENLSDAKFLTGYDVRLLITDVKQLNQGLDNLLNTLIISEISGPITQTTDTISMDVLKDEPAEVTDYDVESAPVVNYVNKIILDAIEKGASDIHFERYDNEYRIRYRLNGVLYSIASPPIKLSNYLLARIKIMSSLDITEHRVPQDGRFKLSLSKFKSIDFRVSVCPTLYGEKIVLRLLDPSQIFHNLDELGMEQFQKDLLINALGHTQGMILVTGPTGSGKTVTLYSSLNYLNSADDNIMTAEDPVEIPLHGINQVHVNPKVGLTFASALRSFLRQDPDIIMVGEIRDLETGQISVQAAQTGHLVLSTLHTNSGPETIARLVYMGIEPFNLASSLILVIAQRLLRTLCSNCKELDVIPNDILLKEGFKPEELKDLKVYKPVSCERCIHGYRGRTGIFEVMPISEEMRYLIMRGANALDLNKQVKLEGIPSLRDSGLDKVRKGLTSLAELNRTFK